MSVASTSLGSTETQFACNTVQQQVSADEWTARTHLAAAYRLVHLHEMTDLIYNHITLRIPGTDHLLINAFGFLYNEVCASNLITVDLQGRIVFAPPNPYEYGLNEAGIVIHTAVHQARPDAHCVIHTHTRAGMAVSAQAEGLLPLTQSAMRFDGHCGFHDFEGPAIDTDEQKRLVADLAKHDVMILRNHGLLAVGATAAQAFNTMYWLELACRAQVDALAGGRELNLPTKPVRDKTARLYQPETRRPFGELEWPAMLRELDRHDPSWRL
ncbi:MAG: class II aldolase/adducin family protein [Burkholderiaceae bacterium]